MAEQAELNFGTSPGTAPKSSETASSRSSRAKSRRNFRRGGWQSSGQEARPFEQLSLGDAADTAPITPTVEVVARVQEVVETQPKLAAHTGAVAMPAPQPRAHRIPWPSLEERNANTVAALTAPAVCGDETLDGSLAGDKWFWIALGGLLAMAFVVV